MRDRGYEVRRHREQGSGDAGTGTDSFDEPQVSDPVEFARPVREAVIDHLRSRQVGYPINRVGKGELLVSDPDGILDYRVRYMRFARWVTPGALRRIKEMAKELIEETSNELEVPELYVVASRGAAEAFGERVNDVVVDARRINIFVGYISDEEEFIAVASA